MKLFDPLTLRGVTLKNRLMISPMCTYRATHEGLAHDWHLAHYGRLAMGGAGLVMTESVSVNAVGRHCYGDLGLYRDDQIAPLARIASFIKAQGCVAALQLQHAGRKASSRRPIPHTALPLNEEDWRLRGEKAWEVVAPSPLPYSDYAPTPHEMSAAEIHAFMADYVSAAGRALQAGFDVIEIHAAHGYLLNEFLSPVSNHRGDAWGGSLPNRMRLVLDITERVRALWPADKPVFVRLSCVDGVEQGWSLEDTLVLAGELKARGVDVIDCSSGGIGGSAVNSRLARGPGFQVPFAERVKQEVQIATVAVGLILTPQQAAAIAELGQADIVAIGREALRDPNWPNAARTELLPEGGFAHWQDPVGWWLDKRAQIIASFK